MALASGTRIGGFEMVEPIGSGGMGDVYRARDLKLGRDAAIKMLSDDVVSSEERLARFEREAQVLAAVNHPGIATLIRPRELGIGAVSRDGTGGRRDTGLELEPRRSFTRPFQ